MTTACSLPADELAAGLRRWAAGQVEDGLMSDRERDVVELLARGVEVEA